MDKNVFIAVALCAGIFLVWQQVYMKPIAEKQAALHQTQQQSATAPNETATTPSAFQTGAQPKAGHLGKAGASKVETVLLGSTSYGAIVSTLGGGIDEFKF